MKNINYTHTISSAHMQKFNKFKIGYVQKKKNMYRHTVELLKAGQRENMNEESE